ncbi:PREDICTED: THUMP domain-containing protein 1 homolog [Nelumbo nucifera]|uniref:THUMP domain-containing protein n=2 Tax=Nelumbo nucifera TaxID=4432 RepID=A0A822ZGF5_NELNU|nr:PREDICTED: THUMP domain-containing protein 1 homolog [Nelumbo nucifera]DAD42549.1 TPA_asm: hypothetical protein HUJ06_000779 [Nelumbo nucifera]
MAGESKPNVKSKKRRQRYLPHNKPVKKGSYPLRPGVQGFFLTCDGGRERQATNEAINVIDSFYEELVHGESMCVQRAVLPNKPMNKITKFSDSDSSSAEDGDDSDEDNESDPHKEDDTNCENPEIKKSDAQKEDAANHENEANEESGSASQANEKSDPQIEDHASHEKGNSDPHREETGNDENQSNEIVEAPAKKQRLDTETSKCENAVCYKKEEKSIDKLIEAELKELGDRNKRRFVSLDSGCNGVVFVQMHKRDGDPSPKEIVQHMMTSTASTRKHVSRFILRVLPVEVTCYASEEEISKAIKPLISRYFPADAQMPQKFSVLYEARANSGIERMAIINSVAKSVPGPHKVDLSNPDKTIIIQIVKTMCLIGVVEKYKELSKYNLRQLTSPKP